MKCIATTITVLRAVKNKQKCSKIKLERIVLKLQQIFRESFDQLPLVFAVDFCNRKFIYVISLLNLTTMFADLVNL